MNMNANDFNVLPIYKDDQHCEIIITHRWTKKRWTWEGPMDDWPKVRDQLLATIEKELNAAMGNIALPTAEVMH